MEINLSMSDVSSCSVASFDSPSKNNIAQSCAFYLNFGDTKINDYIDPLPQGRKKYQKNCKKTHKRPKEIEKHMIYERHGFHLPMQQSYGWDLQIILPKFIEWLCNDCFPMTSPFPHPSWQ